MIPPSRPASCLSDFALDGLVAGELADEGSALRHVASCTECRVRWAERRAERDAFAREAPPLALRAPAPRPKRRWISAAAALGVVAAAVLLHIRSEDGERTKGGTWQLGFYVKHASVVRQGASGERVEPGDAVEFVYSARDPRYIAVLSVDGAGRASVYYPASGSARREPPGAGVALPLSTVLDDTLGEETLYGVACREPFDIEALRRGLEDDPRRAPAPPGCDVETLVLHKGAPLER